MKTSPAMSIPAVIERTAMGIKPANGANYQKAVREWISTRFGRTTLQDPQERIARVVEEACELAQASGMEIADLKAIAAYVYARPPGEVKQEAAGVAVTLFALAEAHRFDLFARDGERDRTHYAFACNDLAAETSGQGHRRSRQVPGSSASGLIGHATGRFARSGG